MPEFQFDPYRITFYLPYGERYSPQQLHAGNTGLDLKLRIELLQELNNTELAWTNGKLCRGADIDNTLYLENSMATKIDSESTLWVVIPPGQVPILPAGVYWFVEHPRILVLLLFARSGLAGRCQLTLARCSLPRRNNASPYPHALSDGTCLVTDVFSFNFSTVERRSDFGHSRRKTS